LAAARAVAPAVRLAAARAVAPAVRLAAARAVRLADEAVVAVVAARCVTHGCRTRRGTQNPRNSLASPRVSRTPVRD
ncbi:MAG: hypothetical protein JNK94_03740, partial [Hyphomonadaceae bacterium]|nr:hypothetical protein [Hyphomonadaceae bacterium]